MAAGLLVAACAFSPSVFAQTTAADETEPSTAAEESPPEPAAPTKSTAPTKSSVPSSAADDTPAPAGPEKPSSSEAKPDQNEALHVDSEAPNDAQATPSDTPTPPNTESTKSTNPTLANAASDLTKQIRAIESLLKGTLSPAEDPKKLFGFSPTDEVAVAQALPELKAKLQTLVPAPALAGPSVKPGDTERAQAHCPPCESSNSNVSPERSPSSKDSQDQPQVSNTKSETKTPALSPSAQLLTLKIQFLSLPSEERLRILADYEQRKTAAEPNSESQEAQVRAELAEEARQRALEAARLAHTEAERLVAEETAHLLQIKKKQAEFVATLAGRKADLLSLEERYLSLQRRARVALASPDEQKLSELHQECDTLARETQKSFAAAVRHPPLRAPRVGANRLADSGISIDLFQLEKLRSSLEREADKLDEHAVEVRWQRRDQIFHTLRGANALRLQLFEALPPERRAFELGLSRSSIERAFFEMRQVVLILRYHAQLSAHWIENLRMGKGAVRKRDGTVATNALTNGAILVQVFLLCGLYLWMRRRLPIWIRAAKLRASRDLNRESNQSELGIRTLSVLSEVHGPLLFLLLLWLVRQRLPQAAQDQFEISLFYHAALWLASANLIIQLINALSDNHSSTTDESSATIRLRSLRLVGRTAAYIGLILNITSQLVGRGTIYHWVIQITWLLVVPTILLLCYWWRPLVHKSIASERRKSVFREAVLRNKTGVFGLLGAGLAGLDLLRVATVRALRLWADEFVLTRRVTAYLFQRELDRRADEAPALELRPLPKSLFDALSPALPSPNITHTSRDDDCKSLLAQTESGKGGIYAIIGERGSGKSTHARRLTEERRALFVTGQETLAELETAFQISTNLPDQSLKSIIEGLGASNEHDLIVIEGAHRLIRPLIGGIAEFDQLIAMNAPHTHRTGWILTFEDPVWNFFNGARGTRPTFDDAVYIKSWSESDIKRLLEMRSELAGIVPNFELLVSALPKDADKIDVLEATEKAKKSFYRLIWDYAAGNPGVALHMWRQSLAVSEAGDIYVQLFQAPRAEDLEDLPDSAAFVLRAIVQLGDATLDELIQLTRLNIRIIEDTIRYGQNVGILERAEQGYSISWAWYRAVTRYLHRRHLLSILNLKHVGVA